MLNNISDLVSIIKFGFVILVNLLMMVDFIVEEYVNKVIVFYQEGLLLELVWYLWYVVKQGYFIGMLLYVLVCCYGWGM